MTNATAIHPHPKVWENEPDLMIWHSHGYLCHIARHPKMMHLCGYVHIDDATHPWYGNGYNTIHDLDPDLSVHGGLTYAREGDEYDWVVGFDCGHVGDLIPHLLRYTTTHNLFVNDVYRDIAYTKAECEELAYQIAQAKK